MDWVRKFSIVKRILAACGILAFGLIALVGAAIWSLQHPAGPAGGIDASVASLALGVGLVSTLALGGLATWLATSSIKQSVESTVMAVCAIAKGDLETKISSPGRDEISWLRGELNGMRKKLRTAVVEVRRTVGDMHRASGEIDGGNTDLSASTSSQSDALASTADSLRQLTDAVQSNAESTQEASQLVEQAATVARSGAATMADVVARMDEIHASASKVGDIVGVIDGIAFQTNILALNAAVEAARAGEQGRGFAVVASEVRQLAQRSATAAREIKSLIEESTTRVKAGTQEVHGAGRTMQELQSGVSRVAQLMRDIAESGRVQRDDIGQLNQSVERIDEMTRRNSALVQQLGASTSGLKSQSDRLAESIRIFHVVD